MPSLGSKIKRIGSRKRDKNSPRSSLASASDQESTLSGEASLERTTSTRASRAPDFAPPAAPLAGVYATEKSDTSSPLAAPASPLDRTTPEQPLEIKANSGGKTFVFKQKPASPSPAKTTSAGSSSSPKLHKHTQFVEPSRPLQRSSSLAQIAREKRQSSLNDTRHFYQTNLSVEPSARPSLSRKSSYADDKRALEYMSKKGTAEGSNLMYRTGSRIWDANKESGWFAYDASSRISSGRPSRRASVAGSLESESSEEDEEDLHPGRFMPAQDYDQAADDDNDHPEFADSYLIRAADWLLGIPHDSPLTLRNALKKKPKKLSLLEKRRFRESTVTDDPAFLLAAYLSIKELM